MEGLQPSLTEVWFYAHSSHLIYSKSELTTYPEQNLEGP